MKTIERNFAKHPHTARFLQTFHTAVTSAGIDHRTAVADDNAAEYELAATEDLLNTIPVEAPAYTPSPAQEGYINGLTASIKSMDAEAGAQAEAYNVKMDGHWTPENTSRWIDRLKAKRDELRKAVPASPKAEVADGRYAVEEGGVLKFFKVKNGRRPGFVFLDIQASDDWHSIRNLTRIKAVLALIAADPKAAMIRYGHELGVCGRCGRTLTDAESRAAGIGPVCIDK